MRIFFFFFGKQNISKREISFFFTQCLLQRLLTLKNQQCPSVSYLREIKNKKAVCLWQFQVWNSFRAPAVREIIERWQTCVEKNPRKSQNCCRSEASDTQPHIPAPARGSFNEIGGGKQGKKIYICRILHRQHRAKTGNNRSWNRGLVYCARSECNRFRIRENSTFKFK